MLNICSLLLFSFFISESSAFDFEDKHCSKDSDKVSRNYLSSLSDLTKDSRYDDLLRHDKDSCDGDHYIPIYEFAKEYTNMNTNLSACVYQSLKSSEFKPWVKLNSEGKVYKRNLVFSNCQQEENYGEDLSKNERSSSMWFDKKNNEDQKRKPFGKPCITKDYHGLTYKSLVTAAGCAGVSPNLLYGITNSESHLIHNIGNAGNIHGAAQLAPIMVEDINIRYLKKNIVLDESTCDESNDECREVVDECDDSKNQCDSEVIKYEKNFSHFIKKKDKSDACFRMRHVLENPMEVSCSRWNGKRCSRWTQRACQRTSIPLNPLRSFFYGALALKNVMKRAYGYMDKYFPSLRISRKEQAKIASFIAKKLYNAGDVVVKELLRNYVAEKKKVPKNPEDDKKFSYDLIESTGEFKTVNQFKKDLFPPKGYKPPVMITKKISRGFKDFSYENFRTEFKAYTMITKNFDKQNRISGKKLKAPSGETYAQKIKREKNNKLAEYKKRYEVSHYAGHVESRAKNIEDKLNKKPFFKGVKCPVE